MTTVAPIGTDVKEAPGKTPTLAAPPMLKPLLSLATNSSTSVESDKSVSATSSLFDGAS